MTSADLYEYAWIAHRRALIAERHAWIALCAATSLKHGSDAPPSIGDYIADAQKRDIRRAEAEIAAIEKELSERA